MFSKASAISGEIKLVLKRKRKQIMSFNQKMNEKIYGEPSTMELLKGFAILIGTFIALALFVVAINVGLDREEARLNTVQKYNCEHYGEAINKHYGEAIC
jgi:uncharacterized membrane protein (DUF485 family)